MFVTRERLDINKTAQFVSCACNYKSELHVSASRSMWVIEHINDRLSAIRSVRSIDSCSLEIEYYASYCQGADLFPYSISRLTD